MGEEIKRESWNIAMERDRFRKNQLLDNYFE